VAVVDPSATEVAAEPDQTPIGATTTSLARARRTRRWPLAAAALLLLLSGAATTGGYYARQAHDRSVARAAAHEAALAAAKDCLAASQPPNAAALPAAQHKLADCSTGDFGEQSTWYGEVLAQAYQAIDVRVRIPEMYAAIERDNGDGSVDALVVFRATVSQTGMADRVNSYRVRVKMVPVDGRFKVAELNQVAK
jgi:Mce-associated membrane protein